MNRMSSPSMLIPTGLLTLRLIPLAATDERPFDMEFAAAITPDNARFYASPASILMHAAGICVDMLLGAFQFSPGLCKCFPLWHRLSGRILVAAGLTAAIGGIWMTQTYTSQPLTPPEPYGFCKTFGLVFILCIFLGLLAIRQRDFTNHHARMMRAYANGVGAGTTVLTFDLALLLWGGDATDQTLALAAAAGGFIDLTVTE
ncbi:MAG: DUF2306 domain-containing protein [Rhodobacterales bacterium]|nr:DUF2306 domain-containing protein [Rhodobacterales bacterium]